jgi:hypothetical protein
MRSWNRHSRRTRLAAIVFAGTLWSAACGGDDGTVEGRADADVPETPGAAAADPADDDIFIAELDGGAERPETIYYDLTRFEWYARGEPLVHDGRRYAAGGALVAAPANAMERVGEYGGVQYYRQPASGDATLFVPVHERYWLQFRGQDAAAR